MLLMLLEKVSAGCLVKSVGQQPFLISMLIGFYSRILSIYTNEIVVITQHTPTLEVISGKLTSPALVRWAPRLPRLQGLELWDGSALEDALVPEHIFEHCPNFNYLMIFSWYALN